MYINFENLFIIIIVIIILLYCLDDKRLFESFTNNFPQQNKYLVAHEYDRKSIKEEEKYNILIKTIQQSKDVINNEVFNFNADGVKNGSNFNRRWFNVQALPVMRKNIGDKEVMPIINIILKTINTLSNRNFTLNYQSLESAIKEEVEQEIKLIFTINCVYNKTQKVQIKAEVFGFRDLSDDIIRNPENEESYYIDELKLVGVDDNLPGSNIQEYAKYKYVDLNDINITYDDADFLEIAGQQPQYIGEYVKDFI